MVEELAPADPDERYPVCLDGEHACPPEDVGGAYGYATFLAAYLDPEHLEHASVREWIGRDFDPHYFDPARATALLRRMS